MDPLNRAVWRGQRDHYEVWYLTLHDPGSGWAFWFRYTINVPPNASAPAEALLWAFSFPPSGEEPALSLLDRHPIGSFSEDGEGVSVGPGRYELGASGGLAKGAVGEGSRRITWDLRLDSAQGEPFQHVSPLLYKLKVASSAVATPAMRIPVSGTVTVGERTVELAEGAFGEQGHVYGRRHAHRWAWAHCCDFEGAPGAVFEGVSGQVKKLGVVLPPASPLCFATGSGDRWNWNSAKKMWAIDSEFSLGRWTFEARQGDVMLRGTISAPPEEFISVEYKDPDGGNLFCHHTESAKTRIDVFRRHGPSWDLDRSYESERTAFECGERTRDERPRRRFDHSEARTP